ncbi:hypothetical protein C5F59_030210 [Streptomyces sp. QL37]|uniref:hypothetical protein n=1 Tax=Streptomyces sp. QL37 TaxID=2093747 RepID=UPI0035BFB30C
MRAPTTARFRPAVGAGRRAGALFAVSMTVSPTPGEILHGTTATAYAADQAPLHAQGRFQSL